MRTLAVRMDGIKNGADVADAAGDGAIGICVQLDPRFLAELNAGNIVFIDVADDPHGGEIGDGEGCGRAGEIYARGGGLVTFCATMTPEMGAYTLTMLLG